MQEPDDHTADNAQSRALVIADIAPARHARPCPRRAAPFLAQLIATREQAPQTRVNRRAEPAAAIARYRAVAGILRKAQ